MPERVVDLLEAVEVEQQQRDRLARILGAADYAGSLIEKGTTVGNARQRVAQRSALEAPHDAFANDAAEQIGHATQMKIASNATKANRSTWVG